MATVTVHLVQAFIENGTGGNGAGIVLDGAWLSREQKQAVAARVALSETAFVLPSERAEFRVEFFTPVRQIPHCGHATVATYHLLARLGRVTCSSSSKESTEDVRRIAYHADGVYMEQKKPVYRGLPSDPSLDELLDSVGTERGFLLPGAAPMIVSTGNPWLVFGLRDEAALAALRPRLDAVARWSEVLGVVGYYPFALPADGADYDVAARMFAPLYGVDEESATGSAAGPLACHLYEHVGRAPRDLIVRQGHLMALPSPSRIFCRLNVADGGVQNLMVGGDANVVGSMEVTVP